MKYVLFCFAAVFIACKSSAPVHTKQEVEDAAKYYDHLILNSDADSIALLYTPDGNLGDIAIGRDSIRNFLSSFKNVKVLEQSSISKSIVVSKDTAIQKGSFEQMVIMNGKDTVRAKGNFTATWQWMDNGWHIKKWISGKG